MFLNADALLPVLLSPVGQVATLAVCLAFVLAWLVMRGRWNDPRYRPAARNQERVVLVVTAVAALLVALGVGALLQQRDARSTMQRELTDRSVQSKALRAQIGAEIDAARRLLADRAVDKIAQEKLAEARAELVRFVPFQDPRILQMIVLIDQELAVRESLRQRALSGAGQ